MNLREGDVARGEACDAVKVVVVAVKVLKEVPRTAIVWALTHVVQPGDFVELLAVAPMGSSGKRLWEFSRFTRNCGIGDWRSVLGSSSDMRNDISDSCFSMMHQLSDTYNLGTIRAKINVTFDSSLGVVAAEAKRARASWIVLEKQLKQEARICMTELQSNVVIVKKSLARFLRLNLLGSSNIEPKFSVSGVSEDDPLDTVRGPATTPTCSPYQGSTDTGASSISSSDPDASPFSLPNEPESNKISLAKNTQYFNTLYEPDAGKQTLHVFHPLMDDNVKNGMKFVQIFRRKLQNFQHRPHLLASDASENEVSHFHQESERNVSDRGLVHDFEKSLREVISVSRYATPVPPLCSVCRHKAPEFGKPPRLFMYSELDLATCGFSHENFLAEGGFGSVHRGVLLDGQVIAVKQHKLASSQGDLEFCSEVEVLSCAQHRNVVPLLGLCLEDGRRMLVYEYICNGSLDSHLYGSNNNQLEWSSRKKIAIGVARGLRYLHEECRVGCIVHRDLRPNNILLTHDFEPLVGDFGLARWQPDGNKGVETRVIGRFGYLAPEYAQSGQITEKADVYSFGVVLLELITGRKAMDIKRPKGQQCLTEWARPLIQKSTINELIDPLLRSIHEQEITNTLRCAYLCIQRDPFSRPRMSHVLRMLEEDMAIKLDSNSNSTDLGYGLGKPYPSMKLRQPQLRLDSWPSFKPGGINCIQ